MEYGDVYDNVFNSVFTALGVLKPIQVTKENFTTKHLITVRQ